MLHIHDLWSVNQRVVFGKVAKRFIEEQLEFDCNSMQKSFFEWSNFIREKKKSAYEKDQREKVIHILKNSTRCNRSTMERESLRKFISANITCIPKQTTSSELDQLCNELDWFHITGKSIIFLQGDFGNVYYLIAGGSVGLYFEQSKDREFAIAREFGAFRGQNFDYNEDDLNKLGTNIHNLSKGSGFGEFAILAATNKIRSCTAVSVSDDTLLLVLHADAYNSILRQHHYRLKQLSSATALLQELPMFKHQNYSKIASIAYCMKSQTYSLESTIAHCNQIINNVFLVVSGNIKVCVTNLEKKEKTGKNESSPIKMQNSRLPKLAVAILGRGQIVGAIELLKGLKIFEYTYVTSSASTEVLELSTALYKESIYVPSDDARHASVVSAKLTEEVEKNRIKRLSRAYDAIKSMMVVSTSANQSKQDMISLLPRIIDNVTSNILPSSTTSCLFTQKTHAMTIDPTVSNITIENNKTKYASILNSASYDETKSSSSYMKAISFKNRKSRYNTHTSSFFVTSRANESTAVKTEEKNKNETQFNYPTKPFTSSLVKNNARNKFVGYK